MKNNLFTIILLTLLMTLSEAYSRQYFDKSKDLLLAHFDLKPDEDDVHSAAALACMLKHSDLSGINYFCVAGAYGIQTGTFITAAVPGLYNTLFGAENTQWTNAHSNWGASVTRARDKAKAVLNAGGKVFIQEAGESNFTYDLCQALINSGVTTATIKSKVIVVQHSQWNEDQSTATKLTWVKNNTDYNKIADGNNIGNGSPGYVSNSTQWLTTAKASGNPNANARTFWTQADNVCDGWTASWDNPYIAAGGVDFSDCVENWWIFDVGTNADDLTKFWARYVTNNSGSSSSSSSSSSSGGGSGLSVSFANPSNDQNFSAPASVYVKVNASDANGTISNVKLYLNNVFLRQENVTPYEWNGSGQNDPSLVNMAAGTYTLQATATDNSGNTLSATRSFIVSNSSSSSGGSTITVQAESLIATGGTYNDGHVPLGVAINATVGINWVNGGDWADYGVNIPVSGSYRIVYYISTPLSGSTIECKIGNTSYGVTSVPNNGSWESYTALTATQTANLTAGTNTVRLVGGANTWQWNLDKFTLTYAGALHQSKELLSTEISGLEIYPNPANDVLNIHLELALNEDARMLIYNEVGNISMDEEWSGTFRQVPIQDLVPGMYILQVATKTKMVTKRFFKQ